LDDCFGYVWLSFVHLGFGWSECGECFKEMKILSPDDRR
jgi:hypothetical protein